MAASSCVGLSLPSYLIINLKDSKSQSLVSLSSEKCMVVDFWTRLLYTVFTTHEFIFIFKHTLTFNVSNISIISIISIISYT